MQSRESQSIKPIQLISFDDNKSKHEITKKWFYRIQQ